MNHIRKECNWCFGKGLTVHWDTYIGSHPEKCLGCDGLGYVKTVEWQQGLITHPQPFPLAKD